MILIFKKTYYRDDLKDVSVAVHHSSVIQEMSQSKGPRHQFFPIYYKWSKSKNQQKEPAEIWISFHLCVELCCTEWKANVMKQQLKLNGENLKEVSRK